MASNQLKNLQWARALCEYCKDFSIASILETAYGHQSSFEALKKSANGGCNLCQLFVESLLEYLRCRELKGEPNGQIWIREESPKELIWIPGPGSIIIVECRREDLLPNGMNGEYPLVKGTLHLVADEDSPSSLYVPFRPINLDPTSDSTSQKIKSWISKCESVHEDCPNDVRSPLPARVIDVGSIDGSREPNLHISNGEYGSYIALSYCWGFTSPAITTRHNLKDHMREITFSVLPRTIQDAISVTRRLGVRFLWVDALCIVQDSVNGQDWIDESSKMASIYGNAYLTIVAEAANDCSQGFLARRPGQSVPPHEIPYYLPDGTECGTVKVCLEDKLEEPHVASRAWTFQEKKLSQRILSFNRQWTTFACQGGYTREHWGPYWEMSRYDTPAPLIYNSVKDCLENWYTSVWDYSKRSMTFEKDKLPAISGYAHHIQKHVHGKYLAGLWDCDLHSGLLWAPVYGGTKPCEPRAPSWSWAAIDGEVWYGRGSTIETLEDHRTTILECSVELSSNDPMGQVSGGFLKCHGPLVKGSWLYRGESLNNVVLYDINNPKIEMLGVDCVLDVADSNYQHQFWCLLIVRDWGLLLELSPLDNKYRRVGYFSAYGDSETSKWPLSTITIV